MRSHAPLPSAFLPRQVDSPLQPSVVNPPLLPQLLALPLQQDLPSLQPSAVCAHPPHLLSVSLQGLGVPPLIISAVRAYAPMLW